MRELTFYGSSDDLFYCDGTTGDEPDEIGCYNRPAVVKIESSEGSVCVVGMYAPSKAASCWQVGLMPVDENIPIPQWPVKFTLNEISSGEGYSAKMHISVPDDAVVTDIGNGA